MMHQHCSQMDKAPNISLAARKTSSHQQVSFSTSHTSDYVNNDVEGLGELKKKLKHLMCFSKLKEQNRYMLQQQLCSVQPAAKAVTDVLYFCSHTQLPLKIHSKMRQSFKFQDKIEHAFLYCVIFYDMTRKQSVIYKPPIHISFTNVQRNRITGLLQHLALSNALSEPVSANA